VLLIEEPVTTAIGANLPISEAMASTVVDISNGIMEESAIFLNDLVCSS
jgi:actin-like ATPase involved in cell morphogenesis